jgi:hypothetical protein
MTVHKISVMKIIEQLEETKRGCIAVLWVIYAKRRFRFQCSMHFCNEKKYVSFSVGGVLLHLNLFPKGV